MLQNSVTKIFINDESYADILSIFNGKFHFGAITPMPEEVQKLAKFNCEKWLNSNNQDQSEYNSILTIVENEYNVSTSQEWCKKYWDCYSDCFDASITDNKIQFKTHGSAPFQLLEAWIKKNKISCDIGNIQDDFEYWSFSSYKNGVLVNHENTLDECLLKVLMMVEEEKPNRQRFKQIYIDCYDENTPKDFLLKCVSGKPYTPILTIRA